ncbi:MAG: DUF1801 domain-containing protein [Gemmatimonadales bacterium]|nr:DUF1801 domain-containing protein [Gemmatimonadales bacterium]
MSASDERITSHIESLADWRGTLLARLRQLIRASGPELVEGWKWSTPVWSGRGNVVAVGAFQDHVKINFFQGAALDDSTGLFNAGLAAKATRAIDVHEGDELNEAAFKALIRAAVALDRQPTRKR